VRLAEAAARTHPAAIVLAALLILPPLQGAPAEEPEQAQLGQAEAESRLGEILLEIEHLKTRLEASRTEQRREQDRLKEADLQTQAANRDLRALQRQQQGHQQELESLQNQHAEYLARLDQRMDQLAEQVRWSYRGSRQSRIKLVLNQDDPAQLVRMLAYYGYFNRAQVDRIALLREALTTLEDMQQSIDRELARIQRLSDAQQALLVQLEEQREQRQVMLAQLASEIGGEASRLRELERNRQDLELLIERLSDVLADIPPDLGSHVGVEKQKGRLPMPLPGPVKHAYGQSRGGGLSWQGWLIGAEAGTEVAAVAYGRVAFADWLRGYGLLLIIDHGGGFMSLYGHNESLLREAGAWVESGDVISIVGANPGSGQGLYFELRKGGRAIDPAAWLAR
jgi:septal ring factor EnvC (AmiA/AmiB activator)